jgi:DMSO/TMAO reductase YedYZ molybdopterin-dependent catalytic subunit
MELPKGQRVIGHFLRFGAPSFARRLPKGRAVLLERLEIRTEEGACNVVPLDELGGLTRREVVADFHCVTTWSYPQVVWSGYPFAAFYERLVVPRLQPGFEPKYIEFRALDGYAVCVHLEDVLEDGVLLADRLNGRPLPVEHGAPYRLVVPQLYGYKNVKHVTGLVLRTTYRRTAVERQTFAHPRGRVALEERGRVLPSWFYRYLYRALFPLTARLYRAVVKSR